MKNLRSTALGLFAGSIIALSSIMGVSAADQSANSSATLLAKQGGKCTAQLSNADLGDYTWSGSNYVISSQQSSFTLNVSQDAAPKMTCDVTIQGSDLKRQGVQNPGADDTIQASSVSLSSVNTNGPLSSVKFTYPSIGTQATAQTVQINNMQNALQNKVPGEYTGTITVTTSLVNP